MIRERISGHYLVNNGQLLKRGIVLLDEERRIVDVLDNGGKAVELPSMRYLNGILVPIKAPFEVNFLLLKNNTAEILKVQQTLPINTFLKLFSEHLAPLNKGECVRFLLLKKLDYTEMKLNANSSIHAVKWLY